MKVKEKDVKREAWHCIVLVEGKEIPMGPDLPLRIAVRGAVNSLGLKIVYLSSGWGMSEEDAEKVNRFIIRQTVPKQIIPRKTGKVKMND